MTAGGAAPPSLLVAGGTVLTPDGPVRADVVVAGGRIAAVGEAVPDGPTLDADGLLVGPGLIELQCNGAVGIDLAAEPERLWEMTAALPRGGVTAWLPTIVTGPPEMRRRALAALRAGPPPGDDRPRADPWTGARAAASCYEQSNRVPAELDVTVTNRRNLPAN